MAKDYGLLTRFIVTTRLPSWRSIVIIRFIVQESPPSNNSYICYEYSFLPDFYPKNRFFLEGFNEVHNTNMKSGEAK